jgi:predicted membrane-bound spermidine synthase
MRLKNLNLPSKLELLVAVNGGAVLVLEIIGSRVMAPFFGTSIYVWTAIIGVILFSLSIGYWYGGKLADKKADTYGLAIIFLLAALVLSLELLALPTVLEYFADSGLPLRISALFSALFVYTLPTSIMGLVSPYISKLAIKNLKHSGETVGRLFAAGTIGSIIGTFLAGYWLTGAYSNEVINASIVLLFIAMAIYSNPTILRQKLVVGLALLALVASLLAARTGVSESVVYQKDTPYARYQVVDRLYNGRPARMLLTDRLSIQSARYTDGSSDSALTYLEQFLKVTDTYAIATTPERFLVIGGGAYSLPGYLQEMFPAASIDVAEIDGELLTIAEQYFDYDKSPNTTNYPLDGRIFLNDTQEMYDMVFLDAFSSHQPPFHLSTLESFEEVNRVLRPGGQVAINVIGSENGERSDYTAAVKRTFDEVFAGTVTKATKSDKNSLQNVMFVGQKSALSNDELVVSYGLSDLETVHFNKQGIILTDSYAPIDKLIQ